MSKYLYMPERASELLDRFRSKWAGKTPRGNIEWNEYDHDKATVLNAIDPETRKAITSDSNAQTEYRSFLRDLTAGEPRDRVKGPTFVHGTQAASTARDHVSYRADLAARVGHDDGEE